MFRLCPPYRSCTQAVLEGNANSAKTVTQQLLDAGTDPQELLNKAMIPAMDEVGRRFETNEYFVPELLISARAMKGALELVKPLLVCGMQPVARVAIGTVKGDLHDIGKNLVAAMLEGGGFEVVDLGVDVSPEKFIEAVKAKNASVVALSALLTTTMPAMGTVIKALEEAGVRKQVKVIIGGAPITRQYAEQIGADGYSDNANGAVAIARTLAVTDKN
ncbi:MAG: corrinoid protein [Candidatus Omnitrophica bacterium]|nr:corrinoid protein [Candidatus Omnitrophota bacterium]